MSSEAVVCDPRSYSRVGAWIRDARTDFGLSQRDFAEAIGKSRSVVANWERDEFVPGTESCRVLAEFFQVPVDEVVGLVQSTRSRQQIIRRAKRGNNPFKELVGGPEIERSRYGGCDACDHERECRERVRQFLPLLCEVWDVHDLYVAEELLHRGEEMEVSDGTVEEESDRVRGLVCELAAGVRA